MGSVRKQKPQLKPGTVYEFSHARKGVFRAVFLEAVMDGEEWFLKVSIPTGPGTGQEHLANTMIVVDGKKQSPPSTEKLLRPELILGAKRHGGD